MPGIIYRMRILAVHIAYVIYSALLWWKLIEIGKITNHPVSQTKVAMGIWFSVFLVLNGYLCISAFSGSPKGILILTWCNISMLVFIGFNLPPFGFTLKHLYEATEHKNQVHPETTNHTCIEQAKIPMSDFILLQMVMPVLLATFIIYPLPQRGYASSEYLAIAVEFMNAFDIMDMVTDVSFVQKYGTIWTIVFYVSLGTSALLIAFPVKIESEDLVWPRNFVICAHSELNIDQAGRSMSMTSILTAPYVIVTDEKVHRRVSISPGVYVDDQSVQEKSNNNRLTSEENSNNTRMASENTFKKGKNVSISDDVFTSQNVNIDNEKQDEVISKTKDRETRSKNNSTKERKEQDQKSEDNSPDVTTEVWRKIIKAILTMVFMDIMFACIRFKIMVTEQSADYGFNMFIKNVIIAGLHMSYLLQHVKSLIVSKLDRIL